jgi:4-amino-4-deoxy-L-arabinose transferase-like glycosyltransferase
VTATESDQTQPQLVVDGDLERADESVDHDAEQLGDDSGAGGGARTILGRFRPTDRARLRSALVVLILAAALVLGSGLRVDSMAHKHGLHTDEALSYVTATGHLGTFETGAGEPRGRWVPAAQWQALWHPQALLDFHQIARDLGEYGIHPALYFLLLHAWVSVLGVSFWSGPLLNLFIDIATGAALFGLARRLFHDSLPAALVALVWALSPAVRLTSSMARMYPLLALFAVLFVWLLLIVSDRRGPPRRRLLVLALLTLATAGGMLTQYQFVLIVAGGALLALATLLRVDWRRCLQALAAMIAGLLITVLAQPGIYRQFRREQAGLHAPFSVLAFFDRVAAAAASIFDFFGLDRAWFRRPIARVVRLGGLVPGHHQPSALALFGLWLVVALAVALLVPAFRRWLGRIDKTGWIALVLLAWIAGTILLQNLAFFSQPKIMSPRYLAVAWPFFAFVPVLVARALTPRAANAIVAGFCLVVLVALSWGPMNYVSSLGSLRVLASTRRAVINCPVPSALPIVMWDMPRGAQVFVAAPDELRADPGAWVGALQSGDYFVRRASTEPNLSALSGSRLTLILASPPRDKISVYEVR